jgi:periplasmic copper chaperone A
MELKSRGDSGSKGRSTVMAVLALLGAALVLAGCGSRSAGSLRVETPWIRAAAGGDNSAAFMTIRNGGSQADRLVAAECPAAMMVEIHQSMEKDGMAMMSPVSAIEAPSRGQVELKPGGYHVMLMQLKKDLKPGDKVELTLTFAKAGRVAVTAEVRKP